MIKGELEARKKIVTLFLIVLSIILLASCIGIEDASKEKPSEDVEPLHLTEAREFMVENHLRGRDITDSQVLDVMGRVPRHLFVDGRLWDEAYSDYPLPIGGGQTISQPYVVALMTQALELEEGEKVLEIGTGSGYQAGVLAELGVEVYTMEIRGDLAQRASERFETLGYEGIVSRQGDGYFGWETEAPFDAIMITAAVNHIPPLLLSQLKDGGRLILPLGSTTYYQTLTLVEKDGDELRASYITTVRFVPLTGEAEKIG